MLAPVSISTVIKPINRRTDVFQIQQIPRDRRYTATSEFQDMARILQSCVDGNHGVPPSCIAYDNHLSFAKLNRFLRGILPMSEYADEAFWRGCQIK